MPGRSTAPDTSGAGPTISRDDVAHLAGLARIRLEEDELDRLAGELPKILDAVATVSQALQGAGDPDELTAMSHPTPLTNVFREDVVRPSLSPQDALAMAPDSDEQRFLVPKILGEE